MQDRFSVEQFAVFIDSHPEWFVIASLDSTLFLHLCRIPREIALAGGGIKPVEWADAIHIATALSRDEPWLLAATDERIKAINYLADKVI